MTNRISILFIIFIFSAGLVCPANFASAAAPSALASRLSGQILLQIEQHGEAWYVNPLNKERYYLKDGAAAFRIMRQLGLGISEKDFAKIPSSDSKTVPGAMAKMLSGRIVLQVEKNGEAWYIYPKNNKKYYLGRPEDAYRIMRELGLGITDVNLEKIVTNGPLPDTNGQTSEVKLYWDGINSQISAGQTIKANLLLDTAGQSINTVSLDANFNSALLSILKVSKESSALNIWVKDPALNIDNGKISLIGGVIGSGFNGRGNLMTVEFRTKLDGQADLSLNNVQVLAADGEGTEMAALSRSLAFKIGNTAVATTVTPSVPTNTNNPGPVVVPSSAALLIRSSSHPKSGVWSNNPNLVFSWTKGNNDAGYNYLINNLPETELPKLVKSTGNGATYSGTKDGIWYFHLRAKSKTGDWSSTLSYQIKIDTQKPSKFSTYRVIGSPRIEMKAQDDLSGISYYEILVDGEKVAETQNTSYQMNLSGSHKIQVRAVDYAGNSITNSFDWGE